ncbi:MAG: TolC family protein [Candidatus Cloacimonetes bacterium]|jgi:outer membrane protein|nr:TolC family protein [Candidatus Cloacimonadota bacterium]MBT6994970.1 TolC family protein [Candidatus Cloacimonadota bacterium]MBT7469802.1 TolC family protein [Candidatus Cloacimonadota bacterium]
MKKTMLLATMLFTMSIFAETITLDESINFALQNNKEILAEQNAVQSAEWQQKSAITNWIPKASFNTVMVQIDGETYDSASEVMEIPVFGFDGMPIGSMPFSSAAMGGAFYQTTFTNKFSVQQPVFNGGKMILGYQLAKLAKEQTIYNLQNKENDIAFQVASLYLNILKLQDLQILSEKSMRSSSLHLKQVEEKFSAGLMKKTDVLQWQVKLQNEKTALQEIENNIVTLISMWQNLIGKNELPAKIDVAKLNIQISAENIEEYLIKVKSQNPILQMLKTTNKMSKTAVKMAKGSFLPSLNLQFDYQIASADKIDLKLGNDDDSWNLMAMFSVPIFSGGTNFANLQSAKYEMKKAKLLSKSAEENLLIGAESAFRNLQTKVQMVNDNKVALNFAKENHKIINELFEQGMITNSEILDADTMLFGGEMSVVNAYYDCILAEQEIKKYLK